MTSRKKIQDAVLDTWGNKWCECLSISEKKLLEAEKKLKLLIPTDLKILFLNCNGGRPDKSYYCVGIDTTSW